VVYKNIYTVLNGNTMKRKYIFFIKFFAWKFKLSEGGKLIPKFFKKSFRHKKDTVAYKILISRSFLKIRVKKLLKAILTTRKKKKKKLLKFLKKIPLVFKPQ
jgi:hypothetical protein